MNADEGVASCRVNQEYSRVYEVEIVVTLAVDGATADIWASKLVEVVESTVRDLRSREIGQAKRSGDDT